MSNQQAAVIAGSVKPEFEPVKKAFTGNFRHGELGAACCVYYHGENVVDLWGGIRNQATGEPWEENTMAMVFSTSKGLSGLAVALAQSRGLLDYDAAVSKYWPEFAQNGKEKITIRTLLAHQAGLFALDAPMTRDLVSNLDLLAIVLAQKRPAWEPGDRQAYHAITLGFYESELIRRVDPKHRSLGQFFHDEIAAPLGLDFYIGLPEDVPNSRLASLKHAGPAQTIFGAGFALTFSVMNPRSVFRQAMQIENTPKLLEDNDHIYPRNIEIPSGNGVGTARAIARAYGVFATGGHELGISEETLKQLMAPPVPPRLGSFDECLKLDYAAYSLGFSRPTKKNPFAHARSFGTRGSGGSFGFADPEVQIGYAYVPNKLGTRIQDPREIAVRNAMYESIGETPKI